MKKTLKKLFLILLMLALVITLAGCGDKDEKDKKDNDDSKGTSQTDKDKKENNDDDSKGTSESGKNNDDDDNKSSNDTVTISKEIEDIDTTLEFGYKSGKMSTLKVSMDISSTDGANELVEMFKEIDADSEAKKELEAELEKQGVTDFSITDNEFVMELNLKGIESISEELLGDSSISDITTLTPSELKEAAKEQGFTVK